MEVDGWTAGLGAGLGDAIHHWEPYMHSFIGSKFLLDKHQPLNTWGKLSFMSALLRERISASDSTHRIKKSLPSHENGHGDHLFKRTINRDRFPNVTLLQWR